MADLLLTLGHNASAIAISVGDDGVAKVENAYELERLSGVKSDSHFPMDAMLALKDRGVRSFGRVFVTHWDPMNHVDALKSKYWDRSAFPPNVPVITQESRGLTHHDCHAHAAIAFAGEFPRRDTGVLVIDGFGNFAEHLSYYRMDESGRPMLVKRYFGYGTSLGLMYQYATAFLGMKMHEDEYKLLGYAAKVNDVGVDRKMLDEIMLVEMKVVLRGLRHPTSSTLITDLAALPAVQDAWARKFESMLERAGMTGHPTDSFEARCVIGYLVQNILETVVRNLLSSDLMLPTNLIVTGGVAFNVELNRMLLKMVPGKLCVMPLAGDQGNSIGLWAHANSRATVDFGDLCWGVRDLEVREDLPEGLIVVDEDDDATFGLLLESLESEGFVNFVRGNMEFGPRALCNTTTLAIPSDPNVVAEINRINGRDTVMPFAPVVRADLMAKVFPDSTRLHKTGSFMVCAVEYGAGVGEKVPGAALHTARGAWTGRPQAYEAKYEGDSVARLLDKYGVLINTSFNVHGVPICLDMKDVVHSHQSQRNLNPKVRTVVITNKKETK